MLRLAPERRKAAILFAGVGVANSLGLENVTPRRIHFACEFKTSRSTIQYYFPTQAELWLAIATHREASGEVVRMAKKLGLLDNDE